ncbi:MAG TPA: class I adenylate-forming enzyme family protein [Acidimicrobiia bacterium]|nr:class I adenylate-forming enzyme family protein [Acidimicrobiia bacterium]
MRAVDVPEDVARVEAELVAPGGAFELEEVDVLGEAMLVFKNRIRSLRDLLANSVGFADKEYVVFTDGVTDRRFTFAEHERLVASAAQVLRDEYGVGPGDRVAILGANSPEWIVTFWATISLGAIAVGLNGWSTGPEIRYGVDDCAPKLLVADEKRLARLEGADPGVPVVEIETGFDALWHAAPDAPLPDQPIAEDDPAIILYTSGTTGRPKGAVHSHRNVGALIGMTFFHGLRNMIVRPTPPDAAPVCQLMTSPLFHVSGLHTGAVAFVASGTKSVWLTGRFDPVLAARTIERERVTGWSITETILHRFVNHPDVATFDLSLVRQVGGGGSPISASMQARTREVFPNAAASMGLGYGLTECTALATINAGDELIAHPESAGRPLPTVQVEIRDPFDTPLPDGEEGEVCVRSPGVMLGYWRRPQETAAAIGEGRWLHTGDIGHIDGGRLYLSSRKRDLILRGGENVYPVEVEKILENHPTVEECAVFGVDDPEYGQAVKAVLVARRDETIDVGELEAYAKGQLAYYKVPTQWEVRDEPLPRNASGKIVKDPLRTGAAPTFIEE